MADAATADPTSVGLTFQDFYILSSGGVDAFAINWTEQDEPPPFYVTVEGRRFAFNGLTYLVKGYGAQLPQWVREEEAAGRLVLFVERDDRLMCYVHDPAATEDDAE
ncbi:MAG: hypothetical protein O2798_09515 [Chloroflexi bacterium]|nr:hypothetical protein [Chloroflexota bacterium]MDA1241065.1 hypothetical protein [Chloroflexota bacterium]